MKLKKTLILLSPAIAIALFILSQPAHADVAAGEQVFLANCAACHSGGNNAIMPDKTLKKDILEKNEMNTTAAIETQVTNGKNAMPAFGGRLDSADISNVAEYVLSQSEQGW